MTAPSRIACPDSELLGAFAEGRLNAFDRTRMIEHLYGCADCASEVATLAAFVGERAGSAARGPAWWWLAAAAFFLVIGGAWLVVQRGRVGAETAPLVAAADGLGYRPVEVRLTGGFRWAAYRGAVRSESETRTPARLKLAGAAGEMLQRAESDRSAAAQHAAGVASVLIEDPAAGIDRLTKLTADQPNDARGWNDLAAAHFAAADRFGRASELPLALAAVDRALRIDSRMPEALFNRALIVERIGLLDEAGRAWAQYLAVDPSSDWAREARRRFDALPRASRPKASASTRPAMETEVLGQWGEATLRGSTAEAEQQLATAREAGIALRRRGESLLGDAVAVIDAAPPADRFRLAEAHVAYRAGRMALAKRDAATARRELLRAAALFSGRSDAGELLARLYIASADYVAGRVYDAERELAALRSDPQVRIDYVALRAQLAWQYGLTQARLARWPVALDEYRSARAAFTALGEEAPAAFLDALAAEGASFLGRRDEAWEGWCRALRVLSIHDFDDRFAVTLGAAARTEWIAGHGEIARSLLDVEIRHGAASGAVRADALLSRMILSARMGDAAAASAELAEATQAVASIANRDAREAMAADLRAAEGIAVARSDPARALAALTQAIGEYGKTRRLLLPATLYERGRVLQSMGRSDEAIGDLEAAVAAVEQQRDGIEWRDIRSGALGGAEDIYTALAALLLRRNETAAAFAVADRAASREFFGAPTAEAVAPATLQRRLGPGQVLVEYLPLPDRLVAFVIDARRIVSRDIAATPATLALRAGALDGAMRDRAGEDAVRHTSAALQELLIAPLDDELRGASSVTFVAPPPLASVPFAALFDARSGRWLIEDHLVRIAASATRSAQPAAMRTNGVVIIHPSAGRSALPSASAEAASLLRIYPGAKLVEGNDATPAAVLDSIASAAVIHYAGHADSERDAGLVLSSATGHDQLLYGSDIVRTRLRAAPLVILAGCGTLRGEGGGDLFSASLARAFLLAGARAVVGTSCDVRDDAAAELFGGLHRALAASGDPAAALREAQLAMIHGPSHDVADWAAAQIVVASAERNEGGEGTP